MTGFLKPHGTSMALYGHFISLSCETDDDVAALESAGLITYPNVDREVFEDELDEDDILCCELVKLDNTGIIDLDTLDNPYRNFDPVYWDEEYWGWYHLPERDSFAVVRDGKYVCSVDCERFGDHRSEIELIEHELEAADNFMPSFSSNIEQRQPMTWNELELRARWNKYPWHSHNCGRKRAKFRIDGKLARKDNRNHRFGNRQEVAELRDYRADLYEELLTIPEFVDYPRIPEFGVEVVGMADDEASRHEAEYQSERADYYRELEMDSWFDTFERDDSHLFEPVTYTDQLVETHERHLFPERFEDYRPYRFSDYWDDYTLDSMWLDDWNDPFMDDRHYDEPDYDNFDLGPTLEEWAELDRIAIERMLEEEADRFNPSFVGSGRSTLCDHINEPRRGKLKRKYGKSTSYRYKSGRPYMQTAAHH